SCSSCVCTRTSFRLNETGDNARHCDAEQKARWPSSASRNGLLLGSCGRFRHDVRPRVLSMERRLPPVHFGASGVYRRDDRPDGEAKTLAVLASYSHDRNGRVLHPDDYSLLCGQRAKPTAVAGISSAGLFDSSRAHRRAAPFQFVVSSFACEANGWTQSNSENIAEAVLASFFGTLAHNQPSLKTAAPRQDAHLEPTLNSAARLRGFCPASTLAFRGD